MNKLKIAILTLALTIGSVASAAIITSYVSHAGEATITPAVTWGNGDIGNRTYDLTGVGGSTYTLPNNGTSTTAGITITDWNIENNANNPVDVKIKTVVMDGSVNITHLCAISHEVYGDGVDPIANKAITTLPKESGDLPFSTEITLPVHYFGTFTITTSVNPA